jgi:hypothetical protein
VQSPQVFDALQLSLCNSSSRPPAPAGPAAPLFKTDAAASQVRVAPKKKKKKKQLRASCSSFDDDDALHLCPFLLVLMTFVHPLFPHFLFRHFYLFLSFFLSFFFLFFFGLFWSSAEQVFVDAVKGSDSASGSIDSPMKTISAAVLCARTLPRPVTMQLRAGLAVGGEIARVTGTGCKCEITRKRESRHW